MRPPASPIAFRGACLRPHAHGWVGVGWREGCSEVKRESKSPKRATAYRMFPATPRHRPPARARTLGGNRAPGHRATHPPARAHKQAEGSQHASGIAGRARSACCTRGKNPTARKKRTHHANRQTCRNRTNQTKIKTPPAYRAYKEYNDREAKVLLAAARRHADAQDSSETKIGISELEYLLTQSNSAFAQVFMSGGRSVLEAQVAAEKAKAEDRRQEGKESESVITSDMATHFQPLFQVGHRPSFQTITAANQAVFEGTDEHKLSL